MVVGVDALAKDFELYYLEKGSYPPGDSWEEFIAYQNFSIGRKGTFGGWPVLSVNDGKYLVDMYLGIYKNLVAFYPNRTNGYAKWLAHSDHPNRRDCLAEQNNAVAAAVCKSMGAKYANQNVLIFGTRVDIYIFP